MAGVGNITSGVVAVDEVRSDMDHIFFGHIYGDIRLRENNLSLHTTGCPDVEVVGPMVIVDPLIFAKSVCCHLVANIFGYPEIGFQEP